MRLHEIEEPRLLPLYARMPQQTRDEIRHHALNHFHTTYNGLSAEQKARLQRRMNELGDIANYERDWTPQEEREFAALERIMSIHSPPTRNVTHLYRNGNEGEFSEFTDHPMTGTTRYAMMNGGRGSGFASGMYAYQTPGEGRIKVNGPHNPLIISKHPKGKDEIAPALFQRDAISLMRMAEDYAELKDAGRHPDARSLKGWGSMTFYDVVDNLERFAPEKHVAWIDVQRAIEDWRQHKQVHPLNILLSRWGYDGIMWDGAAAREGDTGQYGAVLFPPINHRGQVVGLDPVDGKYRRLKGFR